MVQRLLTVVVPAAALTVVAWWSGGYFPRSWGALLLVGAIGLAAVGIVAEQVEVGRRTAALAGGLFALAAWQVVTTAWAVAPDAPLLEAERTLVYASSVLLALLVVPSRRAGDLVLAVLVGAGAATVTGLLAHALGAGAPDGRLELPVGYPNASGIMATTALASASASRRRSARRTRAASGRASRRRPRSLPCSAAAVKAAKVKAAKLKAKHGQTTTETGAATTSAPTTKHASKGKGNGHASSTFGDTGSSRRPRLPHRPARQRARQERLTRAGVPGLSARHAA